MVAHGPTCGRATPCRAQYSRELLPDTVSALALVWKGRCSAALLFVSRVSERGAYIELGRKGPAYCHSNEMTVAKGVKVRVDKLAYPVFSTQQAA